MQHLPRVELQENLVMTANNKNPINWDKNSYFVGLINLLIAALFSYGVAFSLFFDLSNEVSLFQQIKLAISNIIYEYYSPPRYTWANFLIPTIIGLISTIGFIYGCINKRSAVLVFLSFGIFFISALLSAYVLYLQAGLPIIIIALLPLFFSWISLRKAL